MAGARAVEIAQVEAIAIDAGMRVEELASVRLAYPTYAGILETVAASVARRLNPQGRWLPREVESVSREIPWE